MTDDCADICLPLMLYRRGELDPTEAAFVRAHVERCARCAGELEAERALDERLRADLPRPTAPADLRAAVADRLARERRVAVPRAGRSWRPAIAGALAAAAVLLLAVLPATVVLRSRPAPDPLAAPLAEAAAHYRSAALEGALTKVPSSEAERTLAEIARRHGLPTTTAFPGDDEVHLVAARPVQALDRPGALMIFRDEAGRVVTLQIVRAPEVRIPREAGTPVASYRPLLTRRDNVAIALWKQADALYALSAPADEAELARLFLKVRQKTSNPG